MGTFKTEIEIWDLDVLDAIEPVCVLGGELASDVVEEKGKGNKKKKSYKKVKKVRMLFYL